jgi:hypothetical protein
LMLNDCDACKLRGDIFLFLDASCFHA